MDGYRLGWLIGWTLGNLGFSALLGWLASLAAPTLLRWNGDDVKRRARGVGLVTFALLAAMGFRMKPDAPASRIDDRLKQYQSLFADIPEYRARIAGLNQKEAFAVGMKLSHDGMRRLDGDDLVRWNRLRLRLSNLSPAACSAFWTGGMDEKALLSALDQFSDAELDEWARIVANATRAEITAAAPAEASQDALGSAIESVLETLPPSDAERLRKDLDAGEKTVGDEACWAGRTLLGGLDKLSGAARVDAIRALAAL